VQEGELGIRGKLIRLNAIGQMNDTYRGMRPAPVAQARRGTPPGRVAIPHENDVRKVF
jgi:hypothetical protein